jgi:hypothetical protein
MFIVNMDANNTVGTVLDESSRLSVDDLVGGAGEDDDIVMYILSHTAWMKACPMLDADNADNND